MFISILIEILLDVFEIILFPIIQWFTRSFFPWILLGIIAICYLGYHTY